MAEKNQIQHNHTCTHSERLQILQLFCSLSVLDPGLATPWTQPVADPRSGRGHRPIQIVARPPNVDGPQMVARPPNLAVLLTHCGQLILRKKLINLMPPDVRFYS